MNTYTDWARVYPEAAAALTRILCTDATHHQAGSEALVQQRVRTSVARQGAMTWRNNVGATKARCPDCNAPQVPVRFGLANDSSRLNKRIKSSDLIGCIPRTITPAMVGTTIGQFMAVECKRAGWRFTGTDREAGQAAWLALISQLGGFARFTTGELEL
jgi:hypothetical protein